jgi:hypothetical protein
MFVLYYELDQASGGVFKSLILLVFDGFASFG